MLIFTLWTSEQAFLKTNLSVTQNSLDIVDGSYNFYFQNKENCIIVKQIQCVNNNNNNNNNRPTRRRRRRSGALPIGLPFC
jgi:hypothetical protein